MKVKAEDISYALNFLDDDIIAECDRMRENDKIVPVKKKARITAIIPIAAAACLLLVAGGILLKVGSGMSKSSSEVAVRNTETEDSDHNSDIQEMANDISVNEEEEQTLTYGLDSDGIVFYGEDGAGMDNVAEVPADPEQTVISISALDEKTREVITSLAGREACDIKTDDSDFGFTVSSNDVYTDYGLYKGEDGSCYVNISSEDREYTVSIAPEEYELLTDMVEEFGNGSVFLDE